MRNIFRKVLITALASTAWSLGWCAPITYDLKNDWSDTSNPMGTWTMACGSAYTPMTIHKNNWIWAGQPAWADATSGLGHIPSFLKVATNWGAGYDVGIGDIVVHSWSNDQNGVQPQSQNEAYIVWTSPGEGTIDVSASGWLVREIGRRVSLALLMPDQTVSSGLIYTGDTHNRSNPLLLANGTGAFDDYLVHAGDRVALRIGYAGGLGDFAGINFQVAFNATRNAIPEPGTLALLAAGMLGLAFASRRTRSRQGDA